MIRLKRGGRYKPLPPGAKWVGRPSRWGNPWRVAFTPAVVLFSVDRDGVARKTFTDFRDAVAWCIAIYTRYARWRLSVEPRWLDPLRKVAALVCECDPAEPCHADVLIELMRETR